MKASLRSVRIAPKKANLVASMIRGMHVRDAQESLSRTNKKAARILERLVASAIANARQNDNQDADALVIKTLTVNKAQGYHRGVPMARGRVRPMRKFLSHIHLMLGIDMGDAKELKKEPKKAPQKKTAKSTSQKKAAPAKSSTKKGSGSTSAKAETTSPSSVSSKS